MTSTLLCIGYGYCAQGLARRLLPQGWRVIGTTRSAERISAIRATGAEAVVWPDDRSRGGSDSETDEELEALLAEADHLLLSAAPDREGDPVLRALGHHSSSDQRPSPPLNHIVWAGYLSTTGVYGDREGGWVDETSPCTPATQRGKWRLEAESGWSAIAADTGLPLHIFRLAGIYGPGRGPFAKLRAGTARRIVKPGQVFSRTHVDDITQVLEASMARPDPGAIYNVCDDEAAPPQEVIAHAAGLMGLPVPEEEAFETAEVSPMARSFYAESKRVSNRRIREDLGVTLRYPTYREGLEALLASEAESRPDSEGGGS